MINNGYPLDYIDEAINYVSGVASTPKKEVVNLGDDLMAKNLEYAGFWVRFSASIWDSIILGIPAGLLNLLFILFVKVNSLMYLVGLVVAIITIYMEGTKGGSPGKLLLGLRVQNRSGKLIGFGGALLRYIGKILSTLILGIGYLMIAWDKDKQGLHDKIAGSYVIKTNFRKGFYIVGIILGIILPILIMIVLLVFTASLFSPISKIPN